jgi:toxin FitB
MYLIDTNVISEARKRAKANRGVRQFFRRVIKERTPVFLSVVTIGELRRGIELLRHRGDSRPSGAVGGVVRSAAERVPGFYIGY